MMPTEKQPGRLMDYQKKIGPYLDGTLSQEELAEFEAFVMTHPEFETHIRTKQEEIQLLRSQIPAVALGQEALESLETEIRESVFNLLRQEPRSFWDGVKQSMEEWLSR
jgi:anti-sigma factor RsiW